MKFFYLMILFVLILAPVSAWGQFAKLVHYQGVLYNDDGTEFTGTTNLVFSIYTSPLAEEPFWSETHENVEITEGNYEVMLGSKSPLKLSFYEYYLEAKAEGINPNADLTMIVGSGYRLRLWHLFAAYTVAVLAIFFYLVSMARRQKKIISELESLKSAET